MAIELFKIVHDPQYDNFFEELRKLRNDIMQRDHISELEAAKLVREMISETVPRLGGTEQDLES